MDIISKRFDILKIKEENPKLYQKYLVELKYEKITIIKIDESNDNIKFNKLENSIY